jgi:hypothetical protein
LFATQELPKGKVLFTEFPFIYFPPMKRYNMVMKGDACGLCARTIKAGGLLSCVCPSCSRIKYCTKGIPRVLSSHQYYGFFTHDLYLMCPIFIYDNSLQGDFMGQFASL